MGVKFLWNNLFFSNSQLQQTYQKNSQEHTTYVPYPTVNRVLFY